MRCTLAGHTAGTRAEPLKGQSAEMVKRCDGEAPRCTLVRHTVVRPSPGCAAARSRSRSQGPVDGMSPPPPALGSLVFVQPIVQLPSGLIGG